MTLPNGLLHPDTENGMKSWEWQELLGLGDDTFGKFQLSFESGYKHVMRSFNINAEKLKKHLNLGDWVIYASTREIDGEFPFQNKSVHTLQDYKDKYGVLTAALPTSSKDLGYKDFPAFCIEVISNPEFWISKNDYSDDWSNRRRVGTILNQYAQPEARKGMNNIFRYD